ncbi:MAG TPA: hypothetical protein VL201_00650 [Patescibacteria group bacterium]|jgi:hypothetical protein|nr:hypothetical protein [Patescibacteria group bacterium]
MKNKIILFIILVLHSFNAFCESLYIFSATVGIPFIYILVQKVRDQFKIKEIEKQNFAENPRESLKKSYVYHNCDPELIQNSDKLANKVSKLLTKDFNQELIIEKPTIDKEDDYKYKIYQGTAESPSRMELIVNTKSNTINACFTIYPLHARLAGRQEESIADALNNALENELKKPN